MDSKKVLYDLPAPRFVRSGHSNNDLSFFIHDDAVPLFRPFGPKQMGFATFDRRDAVPVNNSHASPSISDDLPRCPPGGVIFCATDFVPGTQTPMHRTLIMDYCVAMSGDIVLALDSGEEKAIRAGDITVQQGVNHMWIDRSQSTCRVAFIMVSSEKLTTKNGEALEETVLKT